PELNISINVLSQEFRQDMKNNMVDLIFSSDYYGFDCEWLPLFEDPYYVAIPESYKVTSKTLEKEFLYQFPIILTEKYIIKKNFELNRFNEIIDYKTEDFSLALDMVKEGVGINFVPKVAIDKRIKGVIYYKITPEIKRTIGIYYKKQTLRKKEIKTLIEYLKNYK
ncbi:MAG: LysR family transcriptional regulator substrate-binding protein, partial [Clostridia bacterium]|nr:LysR family transcriptional regulator substrate-binding protein [Clostridia bacterium]